jgi:hypothetical protein
MKITTKFTVFLALSACSKHQEENYAYNWNRFFTVNPGNDFKHVNGSGGSVPIPASQSGSWCLYHELSTTNAIVRDLRYCKAKTHRKYIAEKVGNFCFGMAIPSLLKNGFCAYQTFTCQNRCHYECITNEFCR